MSVKKNPGQTEWADPDDAPELTSEFFARAEVTEGGKIVRRGRPTVQDAKQSVAIRFPSDTLAELRSRGSGWQKLVIAAVEKELHETGWAVVEPSGRRGATLTDREIAFAKKETRYSENPPHHEHNDCIRMAYEWLDAQVTIKTGARLARPIKHYIEKWCGRYVSMTDVEVAARMHPRIRGEYPDFNISARLVLPSDTRLRGIPQAMTQDYHSRFDPKVYSTRE